VVNIYITLDRFILNNKTQGKRKRNRPKPGKVYRYERRQLREGIGIADQGTIVGWARLPASGL
jgi:hypothetical protein